MHLQHLLLFFKVLPPLLLNNLGGGETIGFLFAFFFPLMFFFPPWLTALLRARLALGLCAAPRSAWIAALQRALRLSAACLPAFPPLPWILDGWASFPFWECDAISLVRSLDGNPGC